MDDTFYYLNYVIRKECEVEGKRKEEGKGLYNPRKVY